MKRPYKTTLKYCQCPLNGKGRLKCCCSLINIKSYSGDFYSSLEEENNFNLIDYNYLTFELLN